MRRVRKRQKMIMNLAERNVHVPMVVGRSTERKSSRASTFSCSVFLALPFPFLGDGEDGEVLVEYTCKFCVVATTSYCTIERSSSTEENGGRTVSLVLEKVAS